MNEFTVRMLTQMRDDAQKAYDERLLPGLLLDMLQLKIRALNEALSDFELLRQVNENLRSDRSEYLKRAEAAELNEKRYLWLRDRSWDAAGDAPAVCMTDHYGVARRPVSGAALDAAIDSEIEGEWAIACAESAHREA